MSTRLTFHSTSALGIVSIAVIWPGSLAEPLIAAHGGYQATMIAHTAQKHFSTTLKHRGQPHSFNMHIMFLRPVIAGKAELEVKDLKLGPGVSTIQVIITQGGKERVAAYVS